VAIYAHLDPSSVTIPRKTPVTRGQLLGTMGTWSGGGSDDEDAWVHFELRFESQRANTVSVLERLVVDGRALTEYKVGLEGPQFYASTNAGARHEQPATGR
jgi:murein DD-endopeptidase MepM/ murein hydrolase activator NlpD